jgi:hypothetical protein
MFWPDGCVCYSWSMAPSRLERCPVNQACGSPRRFVVTEKTNYTKLSKKTTARADNLANLSPYNPVVHETIKDFKPTNI